MSNTDKCRVCLSDGAIAKHLIFENIESKDSVHSKLFQCLQEKQYKKEIYDSDDEVIKEEYDIELCKDEPETDCIEPFNVSICMKPLTDIKKQKTSITDIKAKLKGLKEINFKRKPTRKNNKKASIIASYLRAEFDSSQKSLNSSLVNEKKKEPNISRKSKELVEPKPPKESENNTNLCDICGATLKDKHALNCHQKTKHFDTTPYECTECKKVFEQDSYLKKHIRRIHGNKSLICDTCGRAFAFRGELNTHIKAAHLKKHRKALKNLPCELCDKTFFSLQGLTIHERSAHTGDRPAECKVCGSCFYHEVYLKEHMRLHTGETPYICPICSRGYAHLGNMKSHISHNHRLADLSPELVKNLKPSWLKHLKP